MLKILVVLATTFVFAGLLIAHPYTSPQVELAGAAPKVKQTAQAPAPVPVSAPVKVVQAEQRQQAAKPAIRPDVPVAGGIEATPVAPRPAQPAKRPVQIAGLDVGFGDNPGISTTKVRPAVRQPSSAAANSAPRNDGRHRSQVRAEYQRGY